MSFVPHRSSILLLVLILSGEKPAQRYADHSKLLVVLGPDGKERNVESAEDWKLRREHILHGMEEVMGKFPAAEKIERSRRAALDLRVESEELEKGFLRKRISFLSEPDDHVPAYLLIPRNLQGRVPGILCLHQTTSIGKGEPAGVGGKESLHYAADLAARGYVTLSPDYPNFGDHPFDTYGHGYLSGSMKAIHDNARAVDLLQSLDEVDPGRIGCLGHSLGGHNTLFTSVFDERIKVLVSNCGFTAFEHYYGGDLKGWSSKTYMPKIPAYGGWKNLPCIIGAPCLPMTLLAYMTGPRACPRRPLHWA